MWLLLCSWIVAAAADRPCPEGARALRLDDSVVCAVVQDEYAVVVDLAGGDKREAGEYRDGRREGWWTRWAPDGHVVGETRYEAGAPVAGLRGPTERPRCLEDPPPDGLYGLADGVDADPLLGLPVAVVGGCIGVTAPPDAEGHNAGVTGPNRFVSVQKNDHRCQSGTTVEYLAKAPGLSGNVQVWTRCGGGATRYGEVVPLVRVTPLDGTMSTALLEDLHPATREAALEAIAARQPETWTCEPLGRAVRGAFGDVLARRAMDVAATPCLVEPLRVVLHDLHDPRAAEALGRVADLPTLDDEVLAMARDGDVHSTGILARRRARGGPRDTTLRDALASVLVDPAALPSEREAAGDALEELFHGAEHGEALLGALGKRTPCGARARVIGLAPVQLHLAEVPPERIGATWRPLVGGCDPAVEAATPALLDALERAPEAPDAAWATLVEALGRLPGPTWETHFRDLSCDAASDPTWTTHHREAMDLLRARRCGAP